MRNRRKGQLDLRHAQPRAALRAPSDSPLQADLPPHLLQNLAFMLQNSREPLWVVKVEAPGGFRYLDANSAFGDFTGYAFSEMRGRLLEECFPRARVDLTRPRYIQAAENTKPTTYRIRLLFRDTMRNVEITSTPLFDDNGVCVLLLSSLRSVVSDSTRLNPDAFNSQIIDSLDRQLVVLCEDGKFLAINAPSQVFMTAYGSPIPSSSLLGLNYFDHYRALGQFPGNSFTSSIRAGIESVLKGSSPYFNASYTSDFAGEKRTFNLAVVALKGDRAGVIITHDDITERVSAEETRASLEAQLRESQKRESLGTLASGIAHEFNNLVAVVQGHLVFIRRDARRNLKVLKSLAVVQEVCKTAVLMAEQILAFGRPQAFDTRAHSLLALVEDTKKLLDVTLPGHVQIEVLRKGPSPYVKVNLSQIQQVLLNLCINAGRAMSENYGRIHLEIDQIELTPSSAGENLVAGTFGRITVRDNGPGMDAETKAHVFDSMFSASTERIGSGLGLSVAHSIVLAHGGAITVKSTVGKGSEFAVYLPIASESECLASEERDSLEASAKHPVQKGIGQRILYLDDQRWFVPLVDRMLSEHGYIVRGFIDSKAALDAIHETPDAFDLIITDYKMPNVSGLDIIRAIKSLRPNVPTILLSGFLPEDLQQQANRTGADAILFKPTLTDELAPTIARLLKKTHP